MVQVTRENFQDILPAVRNSLQACEYYAFDCEMTGLFTNDNQQNYLDEVEDRYAQASKDHRMLAHMTRAPPGVCKRCRAASLDEMQLLPKAPIAFGLSSRQWCRCNQFVPDEKATVRKLCFQLSY